ncbi:protein FAR1-RELATED SEQUENCE 6-like [Arachis ipaensis]|uniref:protein FAR1-RELATED SEQUENCE 6-like n=1 Tax=Arachis ipaensis TaxID=130454 RepID=UPI0007AF7F59|nr:protein FAR1-RELATED SEQUENCE 6-like [Arachis ipaensis]
MAGAIRKVLPDTVHRWCIWHIMKKSQFKLGGYARYGELNAMMKHIVWNSPLTESFKVDLAGFIKQFNLGQNRWLADLYANRRKWVPIFFKSEFWAGMRSTQHSEMDEQKVFWGKPVYHTFMVKFDSLSRKDQCECNKFESAGILCCHTLAVWSYYRVDTVPSCYVLS